MGCVVGCVIASTLGLSMGGGGKVIDFVSASCDVSSVICSCGGGGGCVCSSGGGAG